MLVLLASKQGSPRGTEPHISELPAIETQLRLVKLLHVSGMPPQKLLSERSSSTSEWYRWLVVSEALPHWGGRGPLRSLLYGSLSVRRFVQVANSAGRVIWGGRGMHGDQPEM